jgi:hypothetical protein
MARGTQERDESAEPVNQESTPGQHDFGEGLESDLAIERPGSRPSKGSSQSHIHEVSYRVLGGHRERYFERPAI